MVCFVTIGYLGAYAKRLLKTHCVRGLGTLDGSASVVFCCEALRNPDLVFPPTLAGLGHSCLSFQIYLDLVSSKRPKSVALQLDCLADRALSSSSAQADSQLWRSGHNAFHLACDSCLYSGNSSGSAGDFDDVYPLAGIA